MAVGKCRHNIGKCGDDVGEKKKPLGNFVAKWLYLLVDEAGFEPATFGFGGQHSIQLSYPSKKETV